ncbi:hypothetical protein B0H11DRAFT_2354994 [Mycena galericulata]|nr:hypothetical protein B0H11DRAFT_2354994 [Mycena galericulata]
MNKIIKKLAAARFRVESVDRRSCCLTIAYGGISAWSQAIGENWTNGYLLRQIAPSAGTGTLPSFRLFVNVCLIIRPGYRTRLDAKRSSKPPLYAPPCDRVQPWSNCAGGTATSATSQTHCFDITYVAAAAAGMTLDSRSCFYLYPNLLRPVTDRSLSNEGRRVRVTPGWKSKIRNQESGIISRDVRSAIWFLATLGDRRVGAGAWTAMASRPAPNATNAGFYYPRCVMCWKAGLSELTVFKWFQSGGMDDRTIPSGFYQHSPSACYDKFSLTLSEALLTYNMHIQPPNSLTGRRGVSAVHSAPQAFEGVQTDTLDPNPFTIFSSIGQDWMFVSGIAVRFVFSLHGH